MIKYVLFSFFVFSFQSGYASELKKGKTYKSKVKSSRYLSIPYSNHQIVKNYKIYKKQFSKKLCRPNTEKQFWEIYKNYKGQGFYLPVLASGELDEKTIEKHVPEIRLKTLWIGEQINILENLPKNSFKKSLAELSTLKKKLEKLVELKSKFTVTLSEKRRSEITIKSSELNSDFIRDMKLFIKKHSYFLSYNYPLNHLKLRTLYDQYKSRKDHAGKRKANDIYFYRQIVQDGTLSKDGIGSDKGARAVIDTLYLSLNEKKSSFISEVNRFDLEYIFSKYEKYFKYKKKKLVHSMEKWKARNIKKEQFYQNLLLQDKMTKQRVKTILLKKGTSRYELKDFVLKKEAESFYFWQKKEEIYRALFAIETILFGEVGDFEGRLKSERKDIIRVILNRAQIPEYSKILPENMIAPYLLKLFKNKDYLKYKWLNVLFKEGEFSFTYYFLHGNLRIYCPSRTRKARYLENTNLILALNELRNFDGSFKGVRYFSRASMHGRIDMSSLWKRFRAVPEKLGQRVVSSRKLKRLYKKGKYRNLYSFKSIDDLPYRVVEIKRKNYVIPYGKFILYHHRNPHYFKYFVEK